MDFGVNFIRKSMTAGDNLPEKEKRLYQQFAENILFYAQRWIRQDNNLIPMTQSACEEQIKERLDSFKYNLMNNE